VGSSADGSHVFFETQDKLLAADNDGFIDVYDRTSSGTTLVTPGGTDNQGATNAYFGTLKYGIASGNRPSYARESPSPQ